MKEQHLAEIQVGRLDINHLNKSYGQLAVLRDLSLTVGPGEFVSLIGPSGGGKSTLFNILAGLETADSGDIRLGGQPVVGGQFAYMPQRDALMPWRTVLDNAIIGLELANVPRRAAYAQAEELLEIFGLVGFARSYPFELSGGMRQRVSLLRTVLTGRPILLLDEPFGALDAMTRAGLQSWLLELQARLRRTVLFITHDVEEALLLSDRVYVLSQRPASVRLEQTVELPHPRPPEVVTSPAFVSLKASLLAALKSEQAV